MRVGEAFPSDWLKCEDLRGRAMKLRVSHVTLDKIGEDEKPVLHFQGARKGLVLNKTNANMIAESYGDEMDEWAGKEIEIFPDKTSFQGKIVPCIRVRVPVAAPLPAEDDHEIPF